MEMPITKVAGARKATASRRASNAQRKYALQQDVGMFLSFYFFFNFFVVLVTAQFAILDLILF